MPTPPLPEPGKKVTLLLYEKDVVEMKRRWGQGWTTQLREVLHEFLKRGLAPTRRLVR